jgi:putative acetyltransferase
MLMNITLRAERPDDIAAIAQLNDRAFGGAFESRLVETIRSGGNFIPALSIVAVEGNTIVGHILFSRIFIRSGKGTVETLALAPMAVLPEYQKQGIGSRLVRYGIERARELGYNSVVVLGHKEYYPKFGFRRASVWGITSPFPVDDEYVMARELHAGALDEAAGTVEYPPEFMG